ncbi:MAG: hypothetical protein HUJ27_15545 [Rhodobacteraceae bacterium]|nr:hypothetical protein [Paracoccaceae bacterium]
MITGVPLAKRRCDISGLDFDDLFANQFVLTKNKNLEISDFKKLELGLWSLYIGSSLPRCLLTDTKGICIGILLGVAVHETKGILGAREVVSEPGTTAFEKIEAFFEFLSGRFVIICREEGMERVYPDPAASLGVVYDATTKTVGSTTFLVLDREVEPTPTFDAVAIRGGQSNYGLGYTCDANVRRLIANHYLDLGSFETYRYWPSPDHVFETGSLSSDEVVDMIAASVARTASAIIRSRETLLSMSGGRDSRFLVAATGEDIRSCTMAFTFVHNWISEFDSRSADLVSEKLGIPFQRISVDDPEVVERESRFKRRQRIRSFRFATGSISGPRLDLIAGLPDRLPRDQVMLRGNMIELLNAQWYPRWRTMARPNYRHILARLHLGRFSEEGLRARMSELEQWYESLPKGARFRVHDFSYLENFLSNTQPGFYGFPRHFYVAPFCGRKTIELTMRLDPKLRITATCHERVIKRSLVSFQEAPRAKDLIPSPSMQE